MASRSQRAERSSVLSSGTSTGPTSSDVIPEDTGRPEPPSDPYSSQSSGDGLVSWVTSTSSGTPGVGVFFPALPCRSRSRAESWTRERPEEAVDGGDEQR